MHQKLREWVESGKLSWTDDWVGVPVDEERFYAELQKRVETSKVKEGGSRAMDMDDTF